MSDVLTLRTINKSYFIKDREIPILKNIDLTIGRGDFIAIMGPSGSGKSTLLHIMGGHDHPTSGRVAINGKDITDYNDGALSRLRNEALGFVFQNFYLLNYYTALDNVCLPLIYAGTRAKMEPRAREVLRTLGLEKRLAHHPHELSGGERQRVAIARALVNEPLILFADEPTGNLDKKTGWMILELLKDINRRGTTVILITHDPQIAKHANRTIHIEDGIFI